MRYFLSGLVAGSLLAGSRAALAQAVPAYDLAATHRYVQPAQLWPQLQGEFVLQNGDYLLLAVRGQRVLGDPSGSARSLGFDVRQVLLGYENFGRRHPQWSFGATARLVGTGGPVALVPEALLRHRALIFGGLTFGQRLSVERTFSSGATQPLGSGPDGQFWGRLRVDVERFIYFSADHQTGPTLRPRLSYEAATHLRLQKADTDPDERTIQFTALRGELGVRLSPSLDLTPWFAYQTQYQVELPQYQYDANRVLVPVRGGKVNDVYPTVGLDLRLTLLPTGLAAGHQQLPTQH